MQPVVLSNVPVILPLSELTARLRIRESSPQAQELEVMVREAEAIAKPKAMCGVAFIEDRSDDRILVDGVDFTSHVLAVNLASVNRVFPYVATCGTELHEWAAQFDDMLYRYWSEAIRESAMRLAFTAVERYLEATYGVTETSRMNPGSLADWPIEEQIPLFRLIGDAEGQIGVRLTESCLMLPTKSVSGIRFTSSSTWENCMLCPRSVCPNRRAAYDSNHMADRFARPIS